MEKELSERQTANANAQSKKFEEVWRAFTRPQDFSGDEREKLLTFFKIEAENYRTAMQIKGLNLDKNILTKIFTGLFHYADVKVPAEDDKAFLNN